MFLSTISVANHFWQHAWTAFGNTAMSAVIVSIILSDIFSHGPANWMRMLGRRLIVVTVVSGVCAASLLIFRVTGNTP